MFVNCCRHLLVSVVIKKVALHCDLCNFFAADTLCYAVTLTIDLLTLKVSSTSRVTYS